VTRYDAVVVGSGPNGLSAAITLASEGRSVLVLEGAETLGGGARTAALTLPGFLHDVSSAVHPLAVASPFFRTLPLAEHGLEWVHPAAPVAHPFDDGSAAVLERSLEATGRTLGRDAAAWAALMEPFVRAWERLLPDALAPLHLPRRPFLLARFGLRAVRSAGGLAHAAFRDEPARALFGGIAAHSTLPLERLLTAAFGLMLSAAGHASGWPVPRGGSARISGALAGHFRSLGGEIRTGVRVRTLEELPPARAVLLDLTPRQVLDVAGHRLPSRYRAALHRYRYGAGVFKVDWALSGPIPWTAPGCARAGTVHLGGTFAEMAEVERRTWAGEHVPRPYVLLAQPSLFDAERAPPGKHVAWGYCHVPHGSTRDMTAAVEAQVERFAPGFRELVLARSTMHTGELEALNPNLVGGDINGGAQIAGQFFLRPVARPVPYRTPVRGLYICSASTPPGGGVHGMCGWHAARAALRDGF
jgi:phytoene dehydrogenase-like protein